MSDVITAPAIFKSVEQALHFSFLMEIMPVTQKSQMQSLIERMLEARGVAIVREAGSINFAGLSSLEIRGQCAMVCSMVRNRLPQPEIAAVHARFAYQAAKADGVRILRDYCQPLLSTQNADAALIMAWSIYAPDVMRKDFSVRKIAEECEMSSSSVSRDIQRIRNTSRLLLNRAVERLASLFIRSNLVDVA